MYCRTVAVRVTIHVSVANFSTELQFVLFRGACSPGNCCVFQCLFGLLVFSCSVACLCVFACGVSGVGVVRYAMYGPDDIHMCMYCICLADHAMIPAVVLTSCLHQFVVFRLYVSFGGVRRVVVSVWVVVALLCRLLVLCVVVAGMVWV